MIIDVDSHWEVGHFAAGDHPLEPWVDRFPDGLGRLAHGIAGDLLAALGPDERPCPEELLAGLVSLAQQRGGPVILHPQHDSTSGERVDWMDRVGIDHCLVNPGGYWQLLDFLGSDRPAGVRRLNDWLTEQLADHSHRLHATAVVDFGDLDAAVVELERARGRGARGFFLYTVQGRPPGGRSPGHPDWDGVWSAAVDLGMVAKIHVGNTATDFTGWADIGWQLPGGAGVGGLTRLANTARTHAAQNLLSAMLYGGVFARHPQVTVLFEELRVNWLPVFLATLERQALSSPALGEWPWEVSGGEMLRRSVRFTPLPGFGDTEGLDLAEAMPGMAVFSSDYPHLEGNAEPLELYQPRLGRLDTAARDLFLGASMAECFARTGDPLPTVNPLPTDNPV